MREIAISLQRNGRSGQFWHAEATPNYQVRDVKLFNLKNNNKTANSRHHENLKIVMFHADTERVSQANTA